jgi:capsid assembly protease
MKTLLITPSFALERIRAHAETLADLRARMEKSDKKMSLEDWAEELRKVYRLREPYKGPDANGTARIHLFGTLGAKWDPVYRVIGLVTDYEDVEQELAAALGDANVARILLDCESGGGYSLGVHSAARAILAAREQKDVIAYTDDLACSACYYIAAGAHAIYASEDAIIGSIGIRMVFFTYQKMLEEFGISVQEFKGTGNALKTAGSPYRDPTPEESAFIQQSIEEGLRRFQEHVAEARPGLDAEVFQAGHYSGEHAQDLGLIDGIFPRSELSKMLS